MNVRRKYILTFVPVFLFLSVISVRAQDRIRVFASFEDESQVAAVKTSEGVEIRQSTRFPLWGSNSLEVLCPEGGGWVMLTDIPADWPQAREPAGVCLERAANVPGPGSG
ncbi:MAG TPA: hypothetical protein VM123_06925 [archaeon]|nr:hypothetical protein [archaeon]